MEIWPQANDPGRTPTITNVKLGLHAQFLV